MPVTNMGEYTCRRARGSGDLDQCLALRDLCFLRPDTLRPDTLGPNTLGPDTSPRGQRDAFDACCQHFMIEVTATKQIVCCFRVMILPSGQTVNTTYSAQFYDLGALINYPNPILELGRFCIDPVLTDPNILRLAWAYITRLAVTQNVSLLMGCSSFSGTNWRAYCAAFLHLHQHHRAPDAYAPQTKGADIIRFSDLEAMFKADNQSPDRQSILAAMRQMPSLLRTYLTMGGWVSDHAVVDKALGTTHVFTAVEVDRIPPQRRRALLALVG